VDSPLLDRAALAARLAPSRAAGHRLVFTNGCFDLLHAGHVRLLAAARAFGDLLVVGVNSDASVRRLKGPDRPVLGLEERAELLAALRPVDVVAAFEEDTPLELIRCVRPHVLVKGGDWSRDQVVGREVVEAAGGRVEIVQLVTGQSTTALLRRIRGA
jgi:D-beta-D-heptose 7-phosphate kinase/D-beta-D-heptose 1-phosphate adenosyltransferase